MTQRRYGFPIGGSRNIVNILYRTFYITKVSGTHVIHTNNRFGGCGYRKKTLTRKTGDDLIPKQTGKNC